MTSTFLPQARRHPTHGWAREIQLAGLDVGRREGLRRRHPTDMPMFGTTEPARRF